MKSLYIINQPHKLDEALPYITEHDGILLLEDAVMLATNAPTQTNASNLYVLLEDLIARGLKGKTSSQWVIVDYSQFIDLTLEYDKSVSWL